MFRTLSVVVVAAGLLCTPATVLAAPVVDHHQHLLSEAGRDSTVARPLPRIEIPLEMARLLTAREAAWNNKGAMGAVFTADSVVHSSESPGWLTGREAVAGYLSGRFARPYRLTPVSFGEDGSSGFVAGYYTRGDGGEMTYVGYFYLDLVRGAEGAWKIRGETPVFPGFKPEPLVDAARIVALLDEAGIGRAVVLSDAYYFARSPVEAPGELEKVRAENDWTARQIAPFADRLVGACGLNPLRDYAIAEMRRCASELGMRAVKFHFDAASIDLRDPQHLERVRMAFAEADRLGAPIIVHLQAGREFGAEQARIFLEGVLPAAPTTPVHIAHLWGGGGFSDGAADALRVLAEAMERKAPHTRNLYFDVAQVAMVARTPEDMQTIARRMRQIGLDRMLYGSDGPEWGGQTPAAHWAELQAKIPLTPEEFTVIAGNVAPWLK